MWAQLLPKMVGGTLTDDEAPDEPTEIVAYELTDEWVRVIGKDFTFGSVRQYIGVQGAGPNHPHRVRLQTTFGMSATVDMPEADAQVAREAGR